MKFLQFSKSNVVFFLNLMLLLAVANMQSANAQELKVTKRITDPLQNNKTFKGTKLTGTNTYVNDKGIKTKSNKDRILSNIDFVTFDSLINAFSYYTDDQQPLVYFAKENKLITIKRGSKGYSDNLFLRISTDMGNTWGDAILAFDVNSSSNGYLARYPSVYPFSDENNQTCYAFMAPVTDGDGFKGKVGGLYYQGNSVSTSIDNPTIDSIQFLFSTDSKVYGGLDNNNPYALSSNYIYQDTTLSYDATKASNIGLLKTNTAVTSFNATIPATWGNIATWFVQDYASAVYCSPIGIGTDDSKNIYMGACGIFSKYFTDINDARNLYGVSKSTDNGTTWSDFDAMPKDLIQNYATANGFQYGDSIWIRNGSLRDTLTFSDGNDHPILTSFTQDFIVFNNGDVSFFVNIVQGLNDTTLYSPSNWLCQLVEIYRENNVWGIRKITDFSNSLSSVIFPLLYTNTGDVQYGNQMHYEIKAAKTVDGSAVIVKWMQTNADDYIPNDGSGTFSTSDIYFAGRRRGTNSSFTTPVQITNNNFLNRISWIPNIVPNDLKNVPILKIESAPVETDANYGEEYITQRALENSPQYVKIGHFDASNVLAVNDNQNTQFTGKLNITNIYPNPADGKVTLSFESDFAGASKIEITNMTGQVVKVVREGMLGTGPQSININTADLATGIYNVTIDINGTRVSKIMSVVR